MDNRIFNVNGRTHNQLTATLSLALTDEYRTEPQKIKGYVIDKDKGFILFTYLPDKDKSIISFPAFLEVNTISKIIFDWLSTDEAQNIPLGKWEDEIDMDGSIEDGFRVYCEDWGHIGNYTNAEIAVKPCKIWYSK